MLGTTSEHALRALAHMASLPEGSTILGRNLAKSANIPANYLSKILWALGNAGIIDATRGSGGGYRLRKPARDIHLVEVVELFDKPQPKRACFLGGRECSDTDPCAAHGAWKQVRACYQNFLESTTVADLAEQSNGKQKEAVRTTTRRSGVKSR
jgi:Rrf2 family protein